MGYEGLDNDDERSAREGRRGEREAGERAGNSPHEDLEGRMEPIVVLARWTTLMDQDGKVSGGGEWLKRGANDRVVMSGPAAEELERGS